MAKDKPLLDPERAIELLRQQIGKDVEDLPFDDPQLYRWWSTTRSVIQGAFGPKHSNVFEFSSTSPSNFPEQFQEDHATNIRQRKALIEGFIDQLQLFRPTELTVETALRPAVKIDKKKAIADRAARRQAVVLPILEQKNWSPGRLATKAGVSKNSVYAFLDGTRSRISDANCMAIADALEIERHELPE
jgi:hypothetical protein